MRGSAASVSSWSRSHAPVARVGRRWCAERKTFSAHESAPNCGAAPATRASGAAATGSALLARRSAVVASIAASISAF